MRSPRLSSRKRCWVGGSVGLVTLIAVSLSGCAHAAPPLPQVVAVVPVDVLGLTPEEGITLRQSVESAVATLSATQLAQDSDVDQALAHHTPTGRECLAADPCLASLGLELHAPSVLALTLAGLGDTYLVRSRLVASEQGLALQDLQETVVGGQGAVTAYAEKLVGRLFPETPSAPWYRRVWVWAGAAVVVGAGATLTVILLRPGQDDSGVVRVGNL